MRFLQHLRRATSKTLVPEHRVEWRNLCFTLERLQAQLLDEEGRDKYDYAHTYKKFGEGYEKLARVLQQRAQQGDYSFFVKRGVPRSSITPERVDELIRDWHSAIVSKQIIAAKRFKGRFGEEIGVFLETQEHREQIASGASICGPCDAIAALEKYAV